MAKNKVAPFFRTRCSFNYQTFNLHSALRHPGRSIGWHASFSTSSTMMVNTCHWGR